MSYPLAWNYNYGSGTVDLEASAGQVVNNYVRVVGYSGKNVTVDMSTATTGGYGDFLTETQHVLVHVAAYKGSGAIRPARGHWKLAYVKSYSAGANNLTTITLSKSVANVMSGTPIAASLGDDGLYVQLVTVPSFKNVTLKPGKSITCPQFSSTTGTGGIVAFRCSDTLTFSGGHINLKQKGIKSGDQNTFWQAGKI